MHGDLKPAGSGTRNRWPAEREHLEQHPLDGGAGRTGGHDDHYGRLDLAAGELEQMIAQPEQPGRLVVHWLNLLADLEIRGGAGFEVARQTLQEASWTAIRRSPPRRSPAIASPC